MSSSSLDIIPLAGMMIDDPADGRSAPQKILLDTRLIQAKAICLIAPSRYQIFVIAHFSQRHVDSASSKLLRSRPLGAYLSQRFQKSWRRSKARTHRPAPSQDHDQVDNEGGNVSLPQQLESSILPTVSPSSDLPPFPPPYSRKRDLDDEGIGNSSDTPLFSSDDLPASSENYFEHRNKRQRKRTWWDHFKPEYQPVIRTKSKREFKRNVDSAVWMESDTDIDDELDALDVDNAKSAEALRDMALRTLEDPDNFNGPVFPYWDDQPTSTEDFWRIQKAAARRISGCIDSGVEVVRLDNFGLTKLQESTLEPLKRLMARRPVSDIIDPGWDIYESFTPDLQLYLANNQLTRIPGQLFQLQTMTVLSLRGNNLSELPSAITSLINLRELNVSNNNLRWLPYGIRELLGKELRFFGFNPNPFIRAMPRSIKPISPTSSIGTTDPAFLRIDGTIARGSPPTPTTTLTYWPNPTDPTPTQAPFDCTHNVPSLFEASLRACYQNPRLSQLPFLVPTDTPELLVSALKHTWRLKQEGGQRCTICDTPFIIPRTEWIEWWQLSVKAEAEDSASEEGDPTSNPAPKYHKLGSPVPLLRRGCSWSCVPGPSEPESSKNRTGWCPAKGAETDRY
ncbi:MAG: hypothetical protein Q9225_001368 [Loekoesia sp. 1 TL-2023]